ncbi:MAG: TetR family transcriptional regulator [Rhizobiales bacterium 17-65-6]|nr:MAG: TetR family transcriptional regulator [Rhizobiales bacterium 17-65-6]
MEEPSARDRILKSAAHLFYMEGIRSTGVDAIAERAGVTKKTLYYHFTSKDDLIAAYLTQRDPPNLAAFARWLKASDGPLPDRIAGVFAGIEAAARHPKWKGCGFLRTVAELANMPGHPARQVAAAHKKKVEGWLADLFRAEGLTDTEPLARQIAVLIDGVFSAMLVHRDASYAEAAGQAARALVAAALVRPLHSAAAQNGACGEPVASLC